ncbi:hypothetical protein BGZ83_007380 [Gryganskiella cystojenkinii]|nr:hypothetical protein BGZ83_007380 [Gryganskiella cystojenkinii]
MFLRSSNRHLVTTLGVRAQRPESNHLAFLRVCRHWYQVGEPLIWKDVKWSDTQQRWVHERIWNHWHRVRSLEFEYGKRTTDTETHPAPITPVTANGGPVGLISTTVSSTGSTVMRSPSPSPGRSANGSARVRNLLAGGNGSSLGNSSLPVIHNGADRPMTPPTLRMRPDQRIGQSSETIGMEGAGVAGGPVGHWQPKIELGDALGDLAQAMSKPPRTFHWSHQQQQRPSPSSFSSSSPTSSSRFNVSIPLRLKEVSGVYHRPYKLFLPICPQLTSLTLTGLFRLENFLECILPFVPELTYLDICLRCYEWRDEIRLDKVLRTCPKLQYLSVDRNMIGSVHFREPLVVDGSDPVRNGQDSLSSQMEVDASMEDSDDEDDVHGDEHYAGNEWHRRFAKEVVCKPEFKTTSEETVLDQALETYHSTVTATDSTVSSDTRPTPNSRGTSSTGRSQKPLPRVNGRLQRQQRLQRPLVLKTLKLKKIRMTEQDFLSLIRRCPQLEEMDVFSTILWGWSPAFLGNVAKYCPRIRHLHLTTNYVTHEAGGPPGLTNNPASQGVAILDPMDPESQPATTVDNNLTISQELIPPHQPSMQYHQPVQTAPPSFPEGELLYDPVIGLIKLYPDLISYDARFVRFQDQALLTLQQHCRHLERLDLTSCREVSSKSLDTFLRWTPTLRHLSASQVMFQVERLIQVSELHQRRHRRHPAREPSVDPYGVDSDMESSAEEDEGEDEVEDEYDFENGDLDGPLIREELVPRWWACQWLETLILGIQNPALNPHKQRKFYVPVEVSATESQFYNRDLQGSGNIGGGGASSSSSAAAGCSNTGNTPRNANRGISAEQEYIQKCTYALFEQLGRLTKLKRLELLGGQFDLGVGSSQQQQCQQQPHYNSNSGSNTSGSGTHNSGGSPSRSQAEAGNTSRTPKRPQDSKSKSLPESTTSTWRGGLNRVRSFMSLKQRKLDQKQQQSVTNGGQDERRLSSDVDTLSRTGGAEEDDWKDKGSKGKGKARSSEPKSRFFSTGKDKGKQVQRSIDVFVNDLGSPTSHGGKKGTTVSQSKAATRHIRPSGLRPLTNLTMLEHFSMTWANFPRVQETEIEWICQQWPALTWISLGLILEDEWALIRQWFHRRRRDIIVVFEN